jgi:hypothetical protein
MIASIIASIALVLAAGAIVAARRALAIARKADSETPTREEKIAFHRGKILAARELERSVGAEPEFIERIMLAQARAAAAESRERLRAYGIEA